MYVETSQGTPAGTARWRALISRLRRPKLPKGKKKWLLIGAVVVLLLTLVLGLAGRGKGAGESEYTTEMPQVRTIAKTLSGSGTLAAADSYTVTTLMEGDILSDTFEEGDVIQKDAVLYQLDSSDASNNIEKAQLSVDQAQRSYSSAAEKQYVKSTVSGVVYSLEVKAGDTVSAGQTLATVRNSADMTLKIPFPADEARSFYVGQSAVVTLDSTFETLSGTVTAISGSDTVGTGNMITRSVTITVKNPGGLGSGQSATAAVGGVRCAASATFDYQTESVIVAETGGTVKAIHVPEGQRVSKEQTILTLEGDAIEDQIESARENLRSAQLSMESTRDQLDSYTITSPIEGTVVDKQYKAGDTIEAGSVLCTIYDLSYLEMILSVDELDISQVHVGMEVRVTADAVEGKEYTGTVTKVSVAGTTVDGTTTYPVTIRLEDAEDLLPGMNVDAEILVESAENVLSIPVGAVERSDRVLITSTSPSAGNALDQAAPEGYVYVKVESGISDEDYVQILSGLQAGDTVAYIPPSAESSDPFAVETMPPGELPDGGASGGPGGMGGGPAG